MGFSVTARGDREIMVTRDFNAPREMVWDAMTQPEHLRRWMLGPPGWTMTACEDDPRVGGKYRIAWRGPEGEDLAMSGTYREVKHPSRIVRTESFSMAGEPQPGETVGTFELTGRGDVTSLTITLVYPSKAARDGMINSGMEHGMAASYQRLDELLAGTPNGK